MTRDEALWKAVLKNKADEICSKEKEIPSKANGICETTRVWQCMISVGNLKFKEGDKACAADANKLEEVSGYIIIKGLPCVEVNLRS